MTERFEIFPQNVAKDGTLIIIQKELKLYNISDVVDLLNEFAEENQRLQLQVKSARNGARTELEILRKDGFELTNQLNELAEENKKLKQVNEMLQMDFAMTERNLIEENEQLKQDLEHCANQFKEDGKNVLLGLK